MSANSLWIAVGVLTGASAGILGAYAGWRRSRGEHAKAVNTGTALLTLLLALAAGLAVFKVKTSWQYRAFLILAPAFLLHWFVRQVRTVRAGRNRQCSSERHRDGEV
jgi:hypothetical protein